MEEIALNLHIHTDRSDGSASHEIIAHAGLAADLDAIIITDHNVLSKEKEEYFVENNRRILALVGEEINDHGRIPEQNHLLVFGTNQGLSQSASDPQTLIDQVHLSGGLAFLAHPFEDDLPIADEKDYPWVDWQVERFDGIELWNGLSELKSVTQNLLQLLIYVLFPHLIAHQPPPESLKKWDELLISGKKIVAIGGSDAHALKKKFGPFQLTIFPYEFHFRTINTHLLIPHPLTGNLETDRTLVLDALRQGRVFVGYDLPASTRGFRFSAQGKNKTANMGEEIALEKGITLQVRAPQKCWGRLIRDGQVIAAWSGRDLFTHICNQPGIYRIECYINYLGRRRGWIFSNPIYVYEKIPHG